MSHRSAEELVAVFLMFDRRETEDRFEGAEVDLFNLLISV